ncbi:YqaA family protein [Pseudoalteromonas piratica]|uniref:Membrane protein n=1 Tax=Pseudoalteromonas piratica TaxID=1348114 RepID=A0A0A7EDT1_9GAMM|nr:YqaA family protein [Pseudoalteromonas piratica]AIY64226.1 membrane protein [Pseudoalteromonas piratica]
MSYLSLFFTAFIAATLLPTASEGMLAYLIQQQNNIALLWVSATLGNTLGSCVNWWLGKELNRFKNKKWFAVSEQQLEKAQNSFNRYGRASLLFAWLPVVGDPLTFIAGIMRVPFGVFVVLVSIGKAVRYAIVIAMALQFI